MRNNALKFALLVSLLLNVTLLSTAGYRYYRQSAYWVSPFGHTLKKDKFLFEELSLQPEQLKKMKEKAILFRAEIDRRRQAIALKREEMFRLLRENNPDRGKIAAVIAEISVMQEEMQRMISGHILEEKALLDKEQQKKFLDLIEGAMKNGRQMGCPPAEHTQ